MAWRERDIQDDEIPWWEEPDVPAPAPTSTPRRTYAWWSDPDTDPPEWMLDPRTPPTRPGGGKYWNWAGDHWEQLDAPTGPSSAPTAPTAPHELPPDGPWGGGGGGGYQATQRRPLASLNYPQFAGPTFAGPDQPFAYKDYQLPTQEEIGAEPGFDFALKQGIKAYENSKAYLGTYKTGATIKGLNDYARGAATQNADRVISRSMDIYDRNRNNAADAYATNYGISRDVFDRNYTSAKDTYAPKAREAELNFARDWDVYAYEGDDDYRRWKALVDANTP